MPLTPASRAKSSASIAWVSSLATFGTSRNRVLTPPSAARIDSHVGKFAANRRHAGGQLCRLGRARQGADRDVAALQMGKNLGSDGAGAAGDQNGHFGNSLGLD